MVRGFLMLFMIGKHEVNAEVEKKQEIKSKHTGRTLEKLKIHFQVYNQKKVPETIFSKENRQQWIVKNSSYYYTEGNPVIRYMLEIEEVENLKIDYLELNELNIKPYEYYEEINSSKGDSLIIKAIVELKLDFWEKIQELYHQTGYFKVIRIGISKEKKNMRFERIIWSRKEDVVKCALLLYEDIYDKFKSHSPINPELEALKKDLIKNDNTLDFLINLLHERNILNSDDMENIKICQKTMNTLKFGEVEDLEEFLRIYKI
jgi:hypothetical protein